MIGWEERKKMKSQSISGWVEIDSRQDGEMGR